MCTSPGWRAKHCMFYIQRVTEQRITNRLFSDGWRCGKGSTDSIRKIVAALTASSRISSATKRTRNSNAGTTNGTMTSGNHFAWIRTICRCWRRWKPIWNVGGAQRATSRHPAASFFSSSSFLQQRSTKPCPLTLHVLRIDHRSFSRDTEQFNVQTHQTHHLAMTKKEFFKLKTLFPTER